jgi:hypothetical protein
MMMSFTVWNIINVIKSRKIRWAEHVARTGEMGNEYTVLAGAHEGKKDFGRPGRGWKDHIKIICFSFAQLELFLP